MASIINKNQATLSYIETGKTVPTIDTILKIADNFNISTDYILLGIKTDDNDKSDLPLLEIYHELNNDYKTVARYKLKELLKEQEAEEAAEAAKSKSSIP